MNYSHLVLVVDKEVNRWRQRIFCQIHQCRKETIKFKLLRNWQKNIE
ncbi:MAG: hypothetical protein ACRCU2_09680 [Planktothrix sp.]